MTDTLSPQLPQGEIYSNCSPRSFPFSLGDLYKALAQVSDSNERILGLERGRIRLDLAGLQINLGICRV
jgi:hypothetical protein